MKIPDSRGSTTTRFSGAITTRSRSTTRSRGAITRWRSTTRSRTAPARRRGSTRCAHARSPAREARRLAARPHGWLGHDILRRERSERRRRHRIRPGRAWSGDDVDRARRPGIGCDDGGIGHVDRFGLRAGCADERQSSGTPASNVSLMINLRLRCQPRAHPGRSGNRRRNAMFLPHIGHCSGD